MRARSALNLEAGITASSWSAVSAFRIRVRKSAIGSVCIGLPARLRESGDVALVGHLAQADAAEPELAQVRARATAALAAVVVAGLELRGARLAHLLRCLCHYSSSVCSAGPGSPSCSGSSGRA